MNLEGQPDLELLKEEFKCTVTIATVTQKRISFIYNADASRVAQLLIENEIPFTYETDEILLSERDLQMLLDEINDRWGC